MTTQSRDTEHALRSDLLTELGSSVSALCTTPAHTRELLDELRSRGVSGATIRRARVLYAKGQADKLEALQAARERLVTLCTEQGLETHDIERILSENERTRRRVIVPAAEHAYKPSSRDVRHISVTRSNKNRRYERARRFANSHAHLVDLYRWRCGVLASLERRFLGATSRAVKRSLRQAGRLFAKEHSLDVPLVFGGSRWYSRTNGRF